MTLFVNKNGTEVDAPNYPTRVLNGSYCFPRLVDLVPFPTTLEASSLAFRRLWSDRPHSTYLATLLMSPAYGGTVGELLTPFTFVGPTLKAVLMAMMLTVISY